MEPTCSLYKHNLYYLLPIISKALHILNKHLRRLNILFKKNQLSSIKSSGLRKEL